MPKIARKKLDCRTKHRKKVEPRVELINAIYENGQEMTTGNQRIEEAIAQTDISQEIHFTTLTTSFDRFDRGNLTGGFNMPQRNHVFAKPGLPPSVLKKSTNYQYDTDRPRRQATLAPKVREDRFMENFDPETSVREKRKLDRKIQTQVHQNRAGAIYDANGIHMASGRDLCDCLEETCMGCFFECKKCSSNKCGNDCRCNRKFMYELVEYQGYGFEVQNKFVHT